MKILSIDVGIKNLAYCLFDINSETEIQYNILQWDIVNLSEETTYLCNSFDAKTKKNCNKPAKFMKDDKNIYCCLKHSKKQAYLVPSAEQKLSFINKQKSQKLLEIASKYGLECEPKIKKADLISKLVKYTDDKFFSPIQQSKAAEVDLFSIGLNIKNKFNQLFGQLEKIDYVIIENQISPIATRMKTIQGMLVQYFIMSNISVDNMEFISASNKLKDCDAKDKEKYSDRKKLGIAKCIEHLTKNSVLSEKLEYFNQHKKKDDLSDAFLQGLWFINHRIKK